MTNEEAVATFLEWRKTYYYRPDLFVREVLGKDPFPWQDMVLLDVANGVRKIAVRSGHGVGKTQCMAWLIVWWCCTRFPQKTVCTAPSATQLNDALEATVHETFKQLPAAIFDMFELKHERVVLKGAPESSFVSFRTARPETPEVLAGIHSENMLFIPDEASGIHEKIFETSMGAMSGEHAHTVMPGNPVRTTGTFYDAHHKLKGDGVTFGWKAYHVSCLNNVNVTPDFVREVMEKYGENSNEFRVRVLGEFPQSDDDTVISRELVTKALDRNVQPLLDTMPIWGLDVGRYGNDASALAKRRGNVMLGRVQTRVKYDTMKLAGWVKEQYDLTPQNMKPCAINVDVIGIGAGVADRLRQLGLPVNDVNVSEAAAVTERYFNLRSELWFLGREWFEKRDCNIDGDDELLEELVKPKYDPETLRGKIMVESKKKMKARGVKSPNKADAFLLTFATNAAVASGGGGVSSWNKPMGGFLASIV